MTQLNTQTNVLVLGGRENALAILRSLSKKGITVNISATHNAHVLRSHYCANKYPIPASTSAIDYWKDLLITNAKTPLQNNILFACNDDAIEFLYQHREQLEENYILDDFNTDLHHQLLDKKSTLELAKKVGIGTPAFWEVTSIDDIHKLKDEFIYPVILKPTFSHLFQRAFQGKKFLDADNFDQLLAGAERIFTAKLEFIISEKIPGPDTLLSSYYTYHTADFKPLFHFTKQVIRRFPMNHGGGVYHQAKWLPETAELGKQFFQSIGFTGNGNIEFKKDLRDGQYKIIETNTRFTAGHPLLIASDMDIALSIYCHLTHQTLPNLHQRKNISYWYPVQDYMAYKELRNKGLINFKQWMQSLRKKKVYPFFIWSDPLPALYEWKHLFDSKVKSLLHK